jgi:parallel beta-helix repeat protein
MSVLPAFIRSGAESSASDDKRNTAKRTQQIAVSVLALFIPAVVSWSTQAAAATVTIVPGTNIQSVVNAHPAGTTFILAPGIFRMQSVTAKNGDTFIGQPGAILNGSKLLTSFWQERINGTTYWVAKGPTQPGLLVSECDNYFPMCQYPENLYIDSTPLLRASSLSTVTASTCFYDYSAGKVYFLRDPAGHVVESSSTPVAFAEGPSNITIKGLIVEKYATPGQRTTIGDQFAGAKWTVENNEVRLNHGEGVRVANGGQVLNNYIHDNGQMGLAVMQTTTTVLVENNEIARNNWAGFRLTFEAAGAKFGYVIGLIAKGNYVHDNQAIGIWCDGGCQGGIFENNIVENNAFHGIMYEISHGWTVQDNVTANNGHGTSWGEWWGGSGIEIDESDHVTVSGNFVANNYRAIVMQMSRRPGVQGGDTDPDLNNDYVHNNIIVTGGVNGITGLYQKMNDDAYYTSKENRFASNTYCMPASSRGYYWWMNEYATTPTWTSYGEDVHGKWACPGVYLSSPINGSVLSGTVPVTAAAADVASITKVVFSVDGTPVDTAAKSPYTYNWKTTSVTNGVHTLKAEAYNSKGESASYSLSVTVRNP